MSRNVNPFFVGRPLLPVGFLEVGSSASYIFFFFIFVFVVVVVIVAVVIAIFVVVVVSVSSPKTRATNSTFHPFITVHKYMTTLHT